ncbi:hypothetical protein FHT44_005046 [Mycolicibacterium sp. BK634]|uniref:hypothetical protein n=1 Tax=Mycolicibacterium sp. BK634 TaxID=2587099 RepID=UPI001614AF00|nr:hypothetical protein [Mycolicibacterium sp. BK634]MBB3752534.1 hypothetical protein [Mycolicibacterium sp. BK634]
MIEVGKVVTRAYAPGDDWGSRSQPEKAFKVLIDTAGIHLSGEAGKLTPDQAVELGQLLLKAAEVQPEYAKAADALSEEAQKLQAKFKDMVSGIGLNHEVDIDDARGTFTKVTRALG